MDIHLVLSAGGIKSLGYAGALRALSELGVRFKTVSACSAGAFFGACLSFGITPERLVQFVLETDLNHYLGKRTATWIPRALSRMRWPYARFTDPMIAPSFIELVGCDPNFDQLALPFATIGLDLITGRLLVYSTATTPKMKVSEAIRIATAMPFLYAAHVAEGRVVIDGGLASQCPIWLAMVHPENLPIVALAPQRQMVHPREQSLGNFLATIIGLAAVSRDLQLVQQVSRAVLIEHDASSIKWNDTELSLEKRMALVAAGSAAVEKSYAQLGSVANELASATPAPLTAASRVGQSNDTLAELGGTRALSRVNSVLSKEVRNHVFICYAREENGAEWVKHFRSMLTPVLRKHGAAAWDDSSIPPGARWRDEIDLALARSKVALLLVNRAMLDSPFINDVELVAILKAAESEGLSIIWVLVGDCAWEQTPLEPFQCGNDPNHPLESLSEVERNRVVANVARQVGLALS